MVPSNDADAFPRVESRLSLHLRRPELQGIDPDVRLSIVGDDEITQPLPPPGVPPTVHPLDHPTGMPSPPGAAAPPPPAPQMREQEFPSRYVHLGKLGQGGMGTVYHVLDSDLHRRLALKVIRTRGRDDSDPQAKELLTRFLEEAQVTGQLDHPGIVPLHELGVDGSGRVYFTMRLVRGRQLGDVFRRARRGDDGWTRDRILALLVKVCEAMAYAHSRGVVHRDLKPENVMVGKFGEAYVMDWGLAKVRGRTSAREQRAMDEWKSQSVIKTDRSSSDPGSPDGPRETLEGTVFGTPEYMPPEQARGEIDKIDARSDVYAFGAILYELVAGHAPYTPEGSRVAAHLVLRWVVEGPPKPVRELAPDAPPDLVAIVEKCMAREPDARYQDMQPIAEDLRCFLRGRPVSANPLGRLDRAGRWCRRNPIVTAFLATQTLGIATAVWSISDVGTYLVEQAALDSAAMKSEILEDVNALYSSSVVARVDREHVQVTHDYAQHPGAIPLPATFLTELGHRISAHESGMQVRHFSEYPFRFRTDGGPRDAFERHAIGQLHDAPGVPVFRFDNADDHPTLRYATARVLKESCVSCHNTHPDSPKTDWKAGDVRGVLEIIRPLGRDVARTQAGLRGTLLILGGIAVVLVAFGVVVLVRQGREIDRERR